ncbi:MAG: sodium:solute symporter [Treponema sp.]|nr:sodium:solute symporter [Treponema sp.]
MSVLIVCSFLIVYFFLLLLVSRAASKKDGSNEAYFTGNRRSPWFAVAYGMIGTMLSGVTFMSIPGYVQKTQFTYLGVVIGNIIGFAIISAVLLPLYYKLNLTSIYTYLEKRFGRKSQKAGAALFILSRLFGSSLRLYLVVFTLYEFSFKNAGVPFPILAAAILLLILLYTFRGGIKTVVWTDCLQTTCMLLSVAGIFWILKSGMSDSFGAILKEAGEKGMTKIYDGNWKSPLFFWKQIAGGICISLAMTGLDQDMMQKNLSCRTLRESQKNVALSAVLFFLSNVIFLLLGVLILSYAQKNQIPLGQKADAIFSTVALSAGQISSLLFMTGLVAAGYSSADGTIASLTTAFCLDILGFEKKSFSEEKKTKIRKIVHIAFTLCFFLVIVIFKPFHSDSLIATIFTIAGYTYGPLLALFFFGMLMKNRRVRDGAVPFIAIFSPAASFLLNKFSKELFAGYTFGFEILLLNALISFVLLLFFSKKQK